MADAEASCTPCFLCGRPIDYQLTRARPLHRLAGTVHHIIGLAQGGDPLDPTNLVPAHRGCNTRESNRLRAGKPSMILMRQPLLTIAARNSRQW
ncbi:MAG: HNH endonuclease [Pseudonocardiales bacterium]|nr:HNH endonuclease [Pseudonocardiales bacterium]